MTRQEVLDTLNRAYSRVIKEIDHTTDLQEISNSLSIAAQISQLAEIVHFADPELVPFDSEVVIEPKTAVETPVVEAPPVQLVKEEPEEAPAPEPAKPAAKAITRAEARKRLSVLMDQGVNISEIFAQFGASKLSEIPDDKLGELIEKAGG